MIESDERGFLSAGISLSLLTVTLIAVGFAFLSFMKLVLMERADLELQQEIDGAMRVLDTDAMESSPYEIHDTGSSMRIAFQKERSDESQDTEKEDSRTETSGVTYETRQKNGLVKFCRIRYASSVPQPMTGESMFGDVTIESFRVEEMPGGGIHVALEGRSRRTGHAYRQTAVYSFLERKS